MSTFGAGIPLNVASVLPNVINLGPRLRITASIVAFIVSSGRADHIKFHPLQSSVPCMFCGIGDIITEHADCYCEMIDLRRFRAVIDIF